MNYDEPVISNEPAISKEMIENKVVELMASGALVQDPMATTGNAKPDSYQGILDEFEISWTDPGPALEEDASLRVRFYNRLVELEAKVV